MKRITEEQKRTVKQLLHDEWLAAKSSNDTKVCEGMVAEGWLKSEQRPEQVLYFGDIKYGKIRTHYALSNKGITDLVKPSYRLTWESICGWGGRRSWRSHQAHYWIDLVNEKFHVKSQAYDRKMDEIFDTLKEAKDGCRKHDWSFIERRVLQKVAKHTWSTAQGRIVVKYMTAPELRMALPSGQTTTTPGYAIYVDDRYCECAFNLHDAQVKVSYAGKKSSIRIDLREKTAAA